MNKREIISDTAAICDRPRTVVREVLNAAAYATREAVERGEDVFLFGLGKLEVAQRGEKKARNLHTGAPVVVPPRKVVIFRPSDSLTASANK